MRKDIYSYGPQVQIMEDLTYKVKIVITHTTSRGTYVYVTERAVKDTIAIAREWIELRRKSLPIGWEISQAEIIPQR